MILITGATGNIGSELVKRLSADGIAFRAMVRNVDDATQFDAMPGASAVVASFDDRGSVERALEGVERAFLLTPSSENAEAWQRDFVDVAKAAGVRHIVKQSQLHATDDSPVRFLRYHAAVEQAIQASDMRWTFLRPNLFMQGLLMFAEQIKANGTFSVAAGDAAVSAIDVRDIAAVAAAALTADGHDGRIYDLTGPRALTHAEMAGKLSAATGRKIVFDNISEPKMREMLTELKMPEWMREGLIEDYAHYRRGEASGVADGVTQALGREAMTFDAFAEDYAVALR